VFKSIYEEATGNPFPQDARDQLTRAVRGVFESWDNPRAQVYRHAHDIPEDLGTAVNVMQMVFGNKGATSATGVSFTRDPATGEQGLYGEFLPNAQGEDVVAGIRTPLRLEQMQDTLPEAFAQLVDTMGALERHYRDMQDIEFTVEEGKLFLLQTRSAKRTAAAALKAAVSMVEEGLITREDAVARIDPTSLDQLLHPRIDPDARLEPAAKGLNASPGAASGAVVFDADTAAERGGAGEAVVLVRWETTPDDIHGMIAAQGILTVHGGMTSHAAVVARGMGKPCVAGAEGVTIDAQAKTVEIGGTTLREGDPITLDGGTGLVYIGEVKLVPPQINEDFETVLGWADDARRLKVRANADTPQDAAKAREFGAEGIGLCRTEHMFFGDERLPHVQEMIMAEDSPGRQAALDRLLPMQQSDFEGIFEAMAGLPVTIRLLDPPLHEFLPAEEDARDERMRRRIRALHEANPMLGTRGCRLGIMFPEIYEMQVRAIVRAALAVSERSGEAPLVEIMHPLVGFAEELRRLRELTVRTIAEEGQIEYLCGTMIELPRACIRADEIAEYADFFSFGTNDLTQTALGLSRDDAEGKFLTYYLQHDVLEQNPFETLDRSGVGDLMRIAVERGRSVKEDMKLGICGEHGGEARSVAFCEELGLDYVSCSPYRVPLARLAAAQAALASSGAAQYVSAGG
jgi:pyruvate,orthophosphate dikinase